VRRRAGRQARKAPFCLRKFNIRLPKSLHAALVSEAEAEGVSLNQLVVAKLALRLQGVSEIRAARTIREITRKVPDF
jgi:predicted HicB family RNase H-like nuclease